MDSIRQKFLQAWDDFLSVPHLDNEHLLAFAESWQTLCSDWESCLHEADHETRQLVEEVAGKIEGLAGDFYLFESQTLSLEDDLLTSLEDVFASLTLEEKTDSRPTFVSGTTPVITAPSSVERDTLSLPQWLLCNLHNPYPPPHARFSEGRSSNCKQVKDWFSRARQRIGWTRLLRDRFAGCRSITTDAAFRAFVRDDPDNPLDDDLKTAFSAIRSHAELVYGSKAVVPPHSPQRLRSISPTPSLTLSSSSEDTGDELYSTSPRESSFKRPSKRTLSDSSKFTSSKRRRVESSPSFPSLPMGYTSPSTETPARSKKRRLSEGDSDCPRTKRPRGVEDGRLHAASDSLSISVKPTWPEFDQTFQIPDPASTSPPDPTSFFLDFFDPPCIGSPETVSPTDVAASVDPLTAIFEMPQLDLLQPSLPSFDSDWSQFLNFERDLSLFQHSPSLASSLANTPPLVDDATLSPPFLPDSGLPSPDPLCILLPHLSEKNAQYPVVAEPMIREHNFWLLPSDGGGIPSADVLLAIH